MAQSVPPESPRTRAANGLGTIRWVEAEHRFTGSIRVDGRRYVAHGPTERDVRTKLTKKRGAILAGVAAETDSGQYLDAFLENWIAGKQAELDDQVWRSYKSYIRNHIGPGLGHHPLNKLTPKQVEQFMAGRIAAGRAPSTVWQMRAILRAALHDAERWGMLSRNVAALAKPPKYERAEIQPLSTAQQMTFLTAIEGHPFETIYTVAVACGLRQGEILGLRWDYTERGRHVSDVDLDARTLAVRYALHRENGRYVFKPPKTEKSRRTLPLPQFVVDSLRIHRQAQRKARLESGPLWEDHGLVFTAAHGRPQSGSWVTHSLHTILEKANLPPQRFHDLRHCAASQMLSQGFTLQDVAKMLGHSRIDMTSQTYGHLLEGRGREIADSMDARFGKSRKR